MLEIWVAENLTTNFSNDVVLLYDDRVRTVRKISYEQCEENVNMLDRITFDVRKFIEKSNSIKPKSACSEKNQLESH
jgi:hypothetical protein